MFTCLLVLIVTVILFLNVSEATHGVPKNYGFYACIPGEIFHMFLKSYIQLHQIVL